MMAAYASAAWAILAPALGNHLWQSTWVAAIAGALALTMRKHEARVRYALWLTASLKFLVPFSLLVTAGSHFTWPHATPARAPQLSSIVRQAGQPFVVEPGFSSAAHVPSGIPSGVFPFLVFAVWLGGFIAILFAWWLRWRRMSVLVRASMPMQEGPETAALLHLQRRMRIRIPVALRSTATPVEPGIFGIFRPVLLLPGNITDRLAGAHLESVLAHELCHVRRRDNLASAVHLLVEAIFWFHPLVWWIGARLLDERESACDEAVLKLGNDPEVYAESILQTCRYYLESPLPCVSGITGSDLKMRIVRIMLQGVTKKLSLSRKLLLAVAGVGAVSGPIVFGIFNSPQSRAQTPEPAGPRSGFEVASVKPSAPSDLRGSTFQFTPDGGLRVTNGTLKGIIETAYDVRQFQISGGPGWLNTERYDILAKSASDGNGDQVESIKETRIRLQWLLAQRFQLKVHRDTKELPVYVLALGKKGSKLIEAEAPSAPGSSATGIQARCGQMVGTSASMVNLAVYLSRQLDRSVLDRTGLSGKYNFQLEWTPDAGPCSAPSNGGSPGAAISSPDGASIFTALQEQLGLKLEATKGPVDIIVVDRAEKADAN
jgi:bla regulator protein BlaR1